MYHMDAENHINTGFCWSFASRPPEKDNFHCRNLNKEGKEGKRERNDRRKKRQGARQNKKGGERRGSRSEGDLR